MLHYQSALLQSLGTLFYSLPMVLGFTEEKQTVEINLFEDYMEDSVSSEWGRKGREPNKRGRRRWELRKKEVGTEKKGYGNQKNGG